MKGSSRGSAKASGAGAAGGGRLATTELGSAACGRATATEGAGVKGSSRGSAKASGVGAADFISATKLGSMLMAP